MPWTLWNKILKLLLLIVKTQMCFYFCPVQTWMLSGTSRQRRCYPIHEIHNQLSEDILNGLLGFHTFTGCDSTSSLTRYGKRTCWNFFAQNANLLHSIGTSHPDISQVEKFICLLFGASDKSQVNDASLHLFQRGKTNLELLPPTLDALKLHTSRSDYQTSVWLQANQSQMNLTSAGDKDGWELKENILQIVWATLPPVPDVCVELLTCMCKSKCKTARCQCTRSKIGCTPACACSAEGCLNPNRNTSNDNYEYSCKS